MQLAAAGVGLPAAQVLRLTGHSFRVGMVHAMLGAGFEYDHVQLYGRALEIDGGVRHLPPSRVSRAAPARPGPSTRAPLPAGRGGPVGRPELFRQRDPAGGVCGGAGAPSSLWAVPQRLLEPVVLPPTARCRHTEWKVCASVTLSFIGGADWTASALSLHIVSEPGRLEVNPASGPASGGTRLLLSGLASAAAGNWTCEFRFDADQLMVLRVPAAAATLALARSPRRAR
jgi:hypothetical protein